MTKLKFGHFWQSPPPSVIRTCVTKLQRTLPCLLVVNYECPLWYSTNHRPLKTIWSLCHLILVFISCIYFYFLRGDMVLLQCFSYSKQMSLACFLRSSLLVRVLNVHLEEMSCLLVGETSLLGVVLMEREWLWFTKYNYSCLLFKHVTKCTTIMPLIVKPFSS